MIYFIRCNNETKRRDEMLEEKEKERKREHDLYVLCSYLKRVSVWSLWRIEIIAPPCFFWQRFVKKEMASISVRSL